MGKQTSVAMTDEDERLFVAFLRDTGDIQFLESFAPRQSEIFVNGFSPREEGHWKYYVWNKSFVWQPEFGQVTGETSGPRQGWYYLANSSSGPLLEYSRQNFVDSKHGLQGRIYWAKYFASSKPTYNVEDFDNWYQKVVRWIRKNGKQREKGAYNLYYLPDAWSKLGNDL